MRPRRLLRLTASCRFGASRVAGAPKWTATFSRPCRCSRGCQGRNRKSQCERCSHVLIPTSHYQSPSNSPLEPRQRGRGKNRQVRGCAYLQACLPQRGGTATKSSHNDVGTNSRRAPNALFVVAEHASEHERRFVARMSVSEIRGCPACRHSASLRAFTPVFDGLWTRVNALMAHAGYAVLARDLLVPQGGFEPSTYRLRSDCSAVELLRRPQRGRQLVVTVVPAQAGRS